MSFVRLFFCRFSVNFFYSNETCAQVWADVHHDHVTYGNTSQFFFSLLISENKPLADLLVEIFNWNRLCVFSSKYYSSYVVNGTSWYFDSANHRKLEAAQGTADNFFYSAVANKYYISPVGALVAMALLQSCQECASGFRRCLCDWSCMTTL